MVLTKRPTAWTFAAIAASIYATVYFINRTPNAMSHATLMSAASVFDLTVTTSALFYFLLVRRGYASPFAAVAIALAGLRTAGFLLPNADQLYLPPLQWVSLPLEMLLVAGVLRHFKRVQNRDALTRIRNAATAVIPHPRLANLVAGEIAVFYYALFAWRVKPDQKDDSQSFSYAEASGYATFGILLILLILCEGLPLHFLLLRLNPVAAWIWTALDVYGLFWAIAIIRAAQLRTIFVDEHWVHIRISLFWDIEFPREDVASCRRVHVPAASSKTSGYLKAVVLNDPQYTIELHRPAVAHGFYGQRRTVTTIDIAVDQGKAFASALKENPFKGRTAG